MFTSGRERIFSGKDNPLVRALDVLRYQDRNYDLVQYLSYFPKAHVPAEVLVRLYHKFHMENFTYALLNHRKTEDTNQRMHFVAYAPEVAKTGNTLPLKTNTLSISFPDGHKVSHLVTGVGDFEIDKPTKVKMAKLFEVSKNQMRDHAHINDPTFDPAEKLGLIPGMVGPFFANKHLSNVGKVVFLETNTDPSSFLALALTPSDTAIIQRHVFEDTLQWWYSQNDCPEKLLQVPLS
jgi:hypothetical protein